MSHSAGLQAQDGVSYVKEIQMMMHGFGDVAEPMASSAQLIESILLQQMAALWRSACSVAQMQESLKPTVENFVFLMRRDSVKTKRFLKYLKLKRQGTTFSEDGLPSLNEWGKNAASVRLKRCIDYLQLIDPLFDAEEDEYDSVDHQRKIRADVLSRNMDDSKYMEFTKARQVSFGHGKFFASYNTKFREWLKKIDCHSGLINETCDVMAYFAYEIVGEIVDLALLVKQDSLAKDSFEYENNAPLIAHSPSKQMDHRSAITSNEIREAMRRFESTQILPGFLFVRQTSIERTNLLCC